MKRLSAFFMLLFTHSFAQVAQFDKLEQLYDQQHYKIVYRKSKIQMDNPSFDYSYLPRYYKSISSLQLCRNDRWRKNHKETFDDALVFFETLKSTTKGRVLLIAHQEELIALKMDLASWLSDLNRRKEKDLSYVFALKITAIFQDIDDESTIDQQIPSVPLSEALNKRVALIEYAKKFIGVPYIWAGENSDGFDCSGFTSFVMANDSITIPNRAKDQYIASVKISAEEAQIGDLVFFSNGGEISHVGILVSELGKEKIMIHASSSKGITFDKIDGSSYWEKRLYGFGSIIK